MTIELLKAIATRTPFERFTIYMNDGSKFIINEPDGMVIPIGWSIDVLVPLKGDRFSVLYLKNIAHVSSRGTWPKLRIRRRRSNPGWQDGD